jgi:RNA ligase (TIGR02306 family)
MTECMTAGETRKNSTHKVEVVPLVLEKHPNADRLSVAKVWGYDVVTATDQWTGLPQLAAYIPPDSTVDVNRPEFSFLVKDAKADGRARVKGKRLRGVLSFGLLVPAPAGAQVGDDVTELLDVRHYDPPATGAGNQNRGGLFTSGEVEIDPPVIAVKYDLEAGRRYGQQVFEPGEFVVISEKTHGANSRYVYVDGKMYCGSRSEWKKEYPNYDHVTVESLVATGKVNEERASEIVTKLKSGPRQKNMWWQALDATPSLLEFCKANPGVIVYGEVYGAVQDLTYGHQKGQVSFTAFDMMLQGQWLDFDEAHGLAVKFGVPWVPLYLDDDGLPYHKFDFDKVCELAEGTTMFPGAEHVREGVVVGSRVEGWHRAVGRKKLKWVGASYLERAK